MAEDAEHCSPGRTPRTGSRSHSIHDVKVFEGPAERSLRRGSAPPRAVAIVAATAPHSAPPREIPAESLRALGAANPLREYLRP